jgi:TonB family protein
MTANAKSTLHRRLAGWIAGLAGLGLAGTVAAAEPGSMWAALPSASDIAAAYPKTGPMTGGGAVMVCSVTAEQTLKDCVVEQEDPGGFGAASLSLVPKFQASATLADGSSSAGVRVKIPLRFAPPLREVRFPKKLGEYAGLGPVGPYYPERAARRGMVGVAVIECLVGPGGTLTRCKIVGEKPAEEDFGHAAMRMAFKGWIVAAPKPNGEPEGAEEVGRFLVVFGRPKR